ncbi:MAG: hypothetical protein IC227_08570 [Enterococcus lacertideformus]|uniref:Uncharacterized protein n=1 Tax=Enterococcus lacertideformus TaxID=2771493 RepID=A0A931AYX9_9ENTE|nr:hypothetical protein [Enterococcus lacertideformus]
MRDNFLVYGLAAARDAYLEYLGYKVNPRELSLYIDELSSTIDEEHGNEKESAFDSFESLTKFSKEWSENVCKQCKGKGWGLWEDYFYLTQANPKNELKTLYSFLLKNKKNFTKYFHIKKGAKLD